MLGFFLGTKLGDVLPLRMRYKSHATAVAAAAASPQPASSNQQPLKRWNKKYFCRTN